MERCRELRNVRLMEEAKITRIAVASAFGGNDKAFDEMVDSYSPEALRQQNEEEMIQTNARKLQRLFGG